MEKDFAPQQTPKKTTIKFGLFILALIAIIGIINFFPFSKQPTHSLHKKETTPITAIIKTTAPPVNQQTISKKLQFDFYQMLSQIKVPTINNQPQSMQSIQQPYILQIAAVTQLAAATRLQKKLQVLKVTTTIKKITLNNQMWYRIIAGPFPNQNAAEHTQDQLRVHKIDSLLIKTAS